jgi:hypothetical protein
LRYVTRIATTESVKKTNENEQLISSRALRLEWQSIVSAAIISNAQLLMVVQCVFYGQIELESEYKFSVSAQLGLQIQNIKTSILSKIY